MKVPICANEDVAVEFRLKRIMKQLQVNIAKSVLRLLAKKLNHLGNVPFPNICSRLVVDIFIGIDYTEYSVHLNKSKEILEILCREKDHWVEHVLLLLKAKNQEFISQILWEPTILQLFTYTK